MLLSEAKTLTPIHRRILGLAFLGWMFDFYDLILYTYLTRPITDELGLTRMDHSIAIGVSFLATAVGGIASGFLADRHGRRTLVSWTILLYSLGSVISGLANGRELLFVGRAITGMGVGGEWAAGHALVAETFPPSSRGRAGAILQAGAPVGVGLAALTGTLIAPVFGWRACLIGSSVTALLAFFARRSMPESDVWLAGRATRISGPIRDLLAGAYAGRFYLAFVLTVLNGASYWLTYSWLPEYLRSRGLSLGASGTFLLVMVLSELVGYTTFGFVSDRIGRRPAFSTYAVIMALGLIPLAVLWQDLQGSPVLLYGATALVGVGTGTWSNFGPMLAELFPTEVRATSMGTVLNLSRGVQFGAPVLIAVLEPTYGLASGLGLAACFALAASVFIWVLPETKSAVLQ